MRWHTISPSVAATRPLADLRAAYRRTDIIALDLDECIFPGFSQTVLGARVARRLVRRPLRGLDRRLLPKLLLGGVYFAIKEAKRFLGVGTPMRRLVARYERVMRGVPEPYIRDAARSLPGDSYACAPETVALLAEQAPTGIISLGLDVVLAAYREQFAGEDGATLSFCDSNVVRFRRTDDGVRRFDRYDPGAFMEDGASKLRALERRMVELGAGVPTTIGHGQDDVLLAHASTERGGLAIGLNPPLRLRRAFDVVVRGSDWEPLYALVAMLDPRLA